MLNEVSIPNVNAKYRLIYNEDITIKKDRSIEYYTIYKGDDGNLIVFLGYGCESDFGPMPDIEEMIMFAGELADELNENNNLIVYMSQCAGTTIDYDLIYDKKLYSRLMNAEPSSIVKKIKHYISRSIKRTGDRDAIWKYARIIDGEYSNRFPHISGL